MVRKILLSLLSGIVILFVTWIYQNSTFSRSIEDGFFKKIALLWKYELFPDSKRAADFVFINTGKDLALVEDTLDYGNIAVSDRGKIYQLVRQINNTPQGPLFTVVDIQFYYPYTIDQKIDTLLEQELQNNKRLVIPVVNDAEGNYKTPLYKARYAASDYTTFGAGFNKFKILQAGSIKSIPVILDETINESRYEAGWLAARCNGRLCLTAIWPGYYLNNDGVMAIGNETTLEAIGNKEADEKKIETQYYNIGELLLDLETAPDNAQKIFKNKIVFIGNFQEDVHATPVGKMSGPVLLANIYLSLLNKQHIVNGIFLLLLLLVFSALSYVAWFSKMPKIKFNEDIVPSYLSKLIGKYLTYFGCMFFLSLLSIFIFNIQVALFLPSFLFAEIEMRHQTKENMAKFFSVVQANLLRLKNYFKSFGLKGSVKG
jgi:hypothetical protein